MEKHSKEMITLISEKRAQMFNEESVNGVEDSAKYPAQPPPPVPPAFTKIEIYRDPTEFAEVDRRAINVAQEDQKTFTDLVRFAALPALSRNRGCSIRYDSLFTL